MTYTFKNVKKKITQKLIFFLCFISFRQLGSSCDSVIMILLNSFVLIFFVLFCFRRPAKRSDSSTGSLTFFLFRFSFSTSCLSREPQRLFWMFTL